MERYSHKQFPRVTFLCHYKIWSQCDPSDRSFCTQICLCWPPTGICLCRLWELCRATFSSGIDIISPDFTGEKYNATECSRSDIDRIHFHSLKSRQAFTEHALTLWRNSNNVLVSRYSVKIHQISPFHLQSLLFAFYIVRWALSRCNLFSFYPVMSSENLGIEERYWMWLGIKPRKREGGKERGRDSEDSYNSSPELNHRNGQMSWQSYLWSSCQFKDSCPQSNHHMFGFQPGIRQSWGWYTEFKQIPLSRVCRHWTFPVVCQTTL